MKQDMFVILDQGSEENAALEYQIAHSEDDETKEEIARDKLGLVKAGEKIFYDTSN